MATGYRDRNIDDDIGPLEWKSFKPNSGLSVVTRLHHDNSSNVMCSIDFAEILFSIVLLSVAILQAWVQRRLDQLTEKR
jgi:hypothetical protein